MLFEVEDEDGGGGGGRDARGGIGRETRRVRVGADQAEDLIDLVLIGANEQRGVAATQESAGAGQPGGTKITIEQRVYHVIGIIVLDDGYDEFLHVALSFSPGLVSADAAEY